MADINEAVERIKAATEARIEAMVRANELRAALHEAEDAVREARRNEDLAKNHLVAVATGTAPPDDTQIMTHSVVSKVACITRI